MKPIRSLLQTVVVIASLTPSMGSQLRANWRVQYDTSRTCQSGTVVATLQPPSSTRGKAPTSVVFRVAKGPGIAPHYAKTGRVQANGQAKVALPVKEAFAPSKGKASSLSCTLQVGAKIQKVACPALPKCAPPPAATRAPTSSPTHIDTLAPTASPTTVQSLSYDVQWESGPITSNNWTCLDGYLTVTVSHLGRPVEGAALDLDVVGRTYKYPRVHGITDDTGKGTLTIILTAEDVWYQAFSATLTVANPKHPLGYQKYNPVLKIDCPHYTR